MERTTNIENERIRFSSDIWYCAYLMLKGYKIVTYDVIGRGRVKCGFEITEEEWHIFKIEFNNSELIKFKATIEQIKDLAY